MLAAGEWKVAGAIFRPGRTLGTPGLVAGSVKRRESPWLIPRREVAGYAHWWSFATSYPLTLGTNEPMTSPRAGSKIGRLGMSHSGIPHKHAMRCRNFLFAAVRAKT